MQSRISEVFSILELLKNNFKEIKIYLNTIDPEQDQLETCLAFLGRTILLKDYLNPERKCFLEIVKARVVRSRGSFEMETLFKGLN